MILFGKRCLVPIALAGSLLLPALVFAAELPSFGYLERVRVGPAAMVMNAKLDTGADTSSIGYRRIERFNIEDEPWVRFTVQNYQGQSIILERRVERIVRIRRHGAPSVERLVVTMNICLGDVVKRTEVTLADRTRFSAPVLIGRSFLAGSALVNSAREYTTEPDCK